MSFDSPDLDFDPLQDEDDFGLGILSNVGSIHEAVDGPPPDFWDDDVNDLDEFANEDPNNMGPNQYFSWSDAIGRDRVDVSQPHVFEGSSCETMKIARPAMPATATAPAQTNPLSSPEASPIRPQVKRRRLRSKVSKDDVRSLAYSTPPQLPLRWDDTEPKPKPTNKDRSANRAPKRIQAIISAVYQPLNPAVHTKTPHPNAKFPHHCNHRARHQEDLP